MYYFFLINYCFDNFSNFLAILSVDFIVANESKSNLIHIKKEIEPDVKLINHFKQVNNELYFLLNNRVYNPKSLYTNESRRLKGIVEVELPFIKASLSNTLNTFYKNAENQKLLAAIATEIKYASEILFSFITNKENVIVVLCFKIYKYNLIVCQWSNFISARLKLTCN